MGRPERISWQDAARGGSPAVKSLRRDPATGAGEALERLVYVSRAAPCLCTAEVYAIIRCAHAGNGATGVTGALVFLDGWFAQVLEGPAAVLDARFAQIRRDPRHEALQIRQRERVHARAFAGQPMALRTKACLDSGVLSSFGYRAGFPVTEFPADVLVEFIVQACRRPRQV
jgi:Sensors of blue-light using FAD